MVSTWKVILATLVIFTAGLFTGAVLVRKVNRPPLPLRWGVPDGPPPLPFELRDEFVHRLTRELRLNDDQRRRISQIVGESQQRARQLFERLGPEMREELRSVRQAVRDVLTEEQRARFEEMRRRRFPRPFENPDGPPPRRFGPPPGSAPPPPPE